MHDRLNNEPESMSSTSESGHRSTPEELYEQHRLDLLRFLVGVLKDRWAAEDVCQTTFAKAIRNAEMPAGETGRAWLFKVAFHEAIDWRRRRHTENSALTNLAASTPRWMSDRDLVADRETQCALQKELDELPADQRAVVRMRIHENKTFAEIARELDAPLGTVLTRMRLALEKLRGRLKPD